MIYVWGTLLSMLFAGCAQFCAGERVWQNRDARIARRFLIFLAFLPLTLIMAFRYDVGTDYMAYWRMFNGSADSSRMEYGYRLFCQILHLISNNPAFLIFCSSVLICSGYYSVFFKESEDPVYSILLFVLTQEYFIAMNGIRQYMASAIVLFALPYIREKNWKVSLALIIVAVLFHKSAVVMFVFCCVYLMRISPPVCAGIVAVTYGLSSTLRAWVLPILNRYHYFEAYFIAATGYTESDFQRGAFLIFLSFFLMLSIVYDKVMHDKKAKMLYTGLFLALVLASLSGVMPRNFYRMWLYMIPMIIVYVPGAIDKLPQKGLRIVVRIIVALAYGYVCYINLTGGYNDVLPYQTYLNI